MNKFLILSIIITTTIILTHSVYAQGTEEKKEVKITVKDEGEGPTYAVEVITDQDGQKKIINKTYKSLEEMESDSTISVNVSGKKDKIFNIKIDALPEDFEWIESSDSSGHKVIKTEGGNFVFINEGEDSDQHMISYFSDADSNKTVHSYEIKILKEGESPDGMKNVKKNILLYKDDEGNISSRRGGKDNDMEWIGDENKIIKKFTIKKSEISKARIGDMASTDQDFSDFNLATMPVLTLKSINYYPNPNEGEFTLTFAGSKKPVIIRILDQKGNLMYEEDLKIFTGNYNNVVNVKSFDKGTYLLQIHQQGKVLNKKLTLE